MKHREVTIGPVTLIHGDALDVLPDLRGMADCVVTDPPYALTSGGRGRTGDGSMSGHFDADRYDNSGRLFEVVGWGAMAVPIFEACGRSADAYVMADARNIFAAHAAFTTAGWRLHNLLTWVKPGCTPNRWYMKNTEFTLYLFKGSARPIHDCGSRQSWQGPAPRGVDHPTPKPVALMARYIRNSTLPRGLVLDPFAGSGATLIAALTEGRRAIGIELHPGHFETACARVRRAWDGEAVA